MRPVARLRLKYVNSFYDRHGRLRSYLRRPGRKAIALPGPPGSPEFMSAYQAAIAGETAPPMQIGESRTTPGTVAALTVNYFNSMAFQNLAPETKRTRRNILERFREKYGDFLIAKLGPLHPLNLLQAFVSAYRCDHIFRAPGFGEPSACGFSQPMG
jgi:hypothetical protein